MPTPTLLDRVRRAAGDRDSGASEIVQALLPLLEEALTAGPADARAVAEAACAAQPGMAPVWNACAAMLAGRDEPERFTRFRDEATRAPRAVARIAGEALLTLAGDDPEAVVVTYSYSASVVGAVRHAVARRPLTVVCGEGRPRLEGRRLAAALAAAGARTRLTTDAGLSAALRHAAGVIVGADAVASSYWINKVGTHALAALAFQLGRPVVVAASRDKAVGPALEPRLTLPDGRPEEIWPDPPAGIEIQASTFEPIPAELATWFATNHGLLTPADLPAFVRGVRL